MSHYNDLTSKKECSYGLSGVSVVPGHALVAPLVALLHVVQLKGGVQGHVVPVKRNYLRDLFSSPFTSGGAAFCTDTSYLEKIRAFLRTFCTKEEKEKFLNQGRHHFLWLDSFLQLFPLPKEKIARRVRACVKCYENPRFLFSVSR